MSGGTMRAFVMEGIGTVGWAEKPVPEPGPGDAVVRTTAALVCTSDTHTVHGAIGDRENLTLGHEAVGVVEAVGEGVRRIRPGDRVVVGAITPCFLCDNCQRGFTSQCGEALGGWKFANVKDGVFAEYFHVNAAESVPERQELARRYGADEIVNFEEEDPVEAILELTAGAGVDSAIEALGAQATFEACVKSTRPGGTIPHR